MVATGRNVLVVMFDDLGKERDERYWRAPVAASEIVSTPALRGLYDRGVRFTRHRTMPWCTASRAAWKTGRWSFRNTQSALAEGPNAPLPLDEMCVPRMLKLGLLGQVETAGFGKHHLAKRENGGANHPVLIGFDYYRGTRGNLDSTDEQYAQWERFTAKAGGQPTFDRMFEYAPEVTVRDAHSWINSRSSGMPWYVEVNMHLPHAQVHRPPSGTYDATKYVLNHSFPMLGDEPREYGKAMIQAGDFYLAKLLAGIPEEVLANTVIICSSDNGTQAEQCPFPYRLGEPGCIFSTSHAKRTCFDGGILNMLVVAGAGISNPGRTCGHVTSVVDLYSTIAEIMGADLSLAPSKNGRLDSLSFWPVCTNQAAAPARTMGLSEVWGPNQEVTAASVAGLRCTFDANYKLLRTSTGLAFPDAGVQFYDLNADPDELVNLTPGGATGSLTAGQLTAYNALVTYYTTTFAAP